MTVIQSRLVCAGCIVQVANLCDSLHIRHYTLKLHDPGITSFEKRRFRKYMRNLSPVNVHISFNTVNSEDTIRLGRYCQLFIYLRHNGQTRLLTMEQLDSL